MITSLFKKIERYVFIFLAKNSGELFQKYYKSSHWSGESKSGPGSSLAYTHYLVSHLTSFLIEKKINSVADIPCGDFHWMKSVIDSVQVNYYGYDIAKNLIIDNSQKYSSKRISFSCLDITSTELPSAECIICRDLLIHLSNKDALRALTNLSKTTPKFLLISNYPNVKKNKDIITGDFRPVNLSLPPFSLNLERFETIDDSGQMMDSSRHLVLIPGHVLSDLFRREK